MSSSSGWHATQRSNPGQVDHTRLVTRLLLTRLSPRLGQRNALFVARTLGRALVRLTPTLSLALTPTPTLTRLPCPQALPNPNPNPDPNPNPNPDPNPNPHQVLPRALCSCEVGFWPSHVEEDCKACTL